MDIFFTNRYYRLNRSFLLAAGIWPYNDEKEDRIRRILVYVGFTLIFVSQISLFVTSDLSLKLVTEVLTSLVPSVCIFVSYLSTFYHGKMKIMLEHIRFDWYNFNGGMERQIMEKYADKNRLCTIVSLVIFTGVVLSYVLPMTLIYLLDQVAPLNETRTHELPFKVELFIDQEKHFLLFFILIYMMSFIVEISVVASYTLFVIYTLHACSMLEIVGYMLKHLFDTEIYNVYTTKDNENVTSRLIRCVFLHVRTARYVRAINTTYKVSIMIHAFLAFIITFLGFIRVLYLENIAENMKEFVTTISYIISIFFWSFLYSYISQTLLEKSINILDSAYNGSWYLAPYKLQKSLLIIMIKSKRYSLLNVGGVFVGSLNLFASVIQNAMSYALIIYSLR